MEEVKVESSKNTTLEVEENVESLLAYSLIFVTGIIFLLLEKKSKVVRFHAMQSTITFVVLLVFSQVLFIVPAVGSTLSRLVSLAGFILWIVLMVKAYQGEKFKLPVVGDIAEKELNK